VSPDDSCETRFQALLALDHSRREPWGSRHGSAFAVFTLQHPAGQTREVLERCWTLLYRIWVAGDDPEVVTRALRQMNEGRPGCLNAPPLPSDAGGPKRFPVTIERLGDFEAEQYPRLLERWCRATLETIGIQPS
jgi:hypothetical protein